MKLRGISDVGFCRIESCLTITASEKIDQEKKEYFINRTNKHISLVQKYCKKLEDEWPELEGLIKRGKKHDTSKFEDDELIPYIWLTWRYKCEDDDVECHLPEGMEDEINEATKHHILNNRHHPEFHQDKTENLINEDDRDKPPKKAIDATKMEDLDIAEMVADWCAMSEERGNTPHEWADKNVGKRWKFTKDQEELIYTLIDSVWDE